MPVTGFNLPIAGLSGTGDKVVISARTDKLACVHSFSKNGNIVSGWVSIADLKFKGESDATLSGSTGFGEWEGPWATITIRRGGDRFLIVEGESSVGAPDNPRTGNIDGPAFLSGGDKIAGYDEAQYRGNEPANAAGKSETACRVQLKISIILLYIMTGLNPVYAGESVQQLYRAMHKVNWRDDATWRAAVSADFGTSVFPDSSLSDDARTDNVMHKLEALVKPNTISADLKEEIRSISDPRITYYKVPRKDIYFFGNVQGSGNCSNNIWGAKKGNFLVELQDVPIQGADECDAPIVFGKYLGSSIIIKLQYLRESPRLGGNPSIVSVVEANPSTWSNVCKIEVNTKK